MEALYYYELLAKGISERYIIIEVHRRLVIAGGIHRVLWLLRHRLVSGISVAATRRRLTSLRCGGVRRHLLAYPLAMALWCSLLLVSSVAARLVRRLGVQHLHFLNDNLGGVALLPLLILPFAGVQLTLQVDF